MPASGVVPTDIDTGLDRPLTSAETARLTKWITDAETLIGLRVPADVELDPATLTMIVRAAVEYRWEQSRSGGASAVTVAVDDGSVTRRYESGNPKGAAWWFLPEWWEWLNPSGETGAFSTRPGFEADFASWPAGYGYSAFPHHWVGP